MKNLTIYTKIKEVINNSFLCVFTKKYQEEKNETELLCNIIFKLQSDNYDLDSRIKVLEKIKKKDK